LETLHEVASIFEKPGEQKKLQEEEYLLWESGPASREECCVELLSPLPIYTESNERIRHISFISVQEFFGAFYGGGRGWRRAFPAWSFLEMKGGGAGVAGDVVDFLESFSV
jgi:hypothetical protein